MNTSNLYGKWLLSNVIALMCVCGTVSAANQLSTGSVQIEIGGGSTTSSGSYSAMQQRVQVLRALVKTKANTPSTTGKAFENYLTLGTFLTDVCSRLGEGMPKVSSQTPIKRTGIDLQTASGKKLRSAIQKCVYAGILDQRSAMKTFSSPIHRRFLEEFYRTKLYLSIPAEKALQDDDYITMKYWEEEFHYRVPTYYGAKRMLELSSWGTNAAYTNDMIQSASFEPLAQAYSQIQQNYHYVSGGVNDETLIYGALQGMVDALHDPFSVYFPPEKNVDFFNSIQGEFYGIGSYVDSIDGYFTLQSIIKGSPAEEAGLQPGDRVIRVGDWDVPASFTVNEVVAKIKGPVGTRVNLTIMRGGVSRMISVERRKISIPLLSTGVQDDMFVRTISSFGLGLDSQFAKSLVDDAPSISAARKLVIDLRHNGGGYTDVVNRMLQSFVNSGDIMIQYEYAHNNEKVLSLGSLNPLFVGKKIYILVDGSTASASEIMAGVIREYVPGAKIIGKQTFGKGSMQTLIGLPTSASIKYTIALRYYGASKTSIEKVGITPDVDVVDDRATKNDEVIDAVRKD